MKVLIFMAQISPLNGAERLDVELAEELNKRGIHADILSMYTENLPAVPEAKQDLLDRCIPTVNFLGMRVHPPLTSLLPAIRRLRKLIREQEYDIVETSMVSPTVLASWATRGTRARHVAGLHDVFTKKRYNRKTHLVWRWSVRMNSRVRFYAISDYAKRHWLEYSSTSPERTTTIYNGIPNECFDALPERERVRAELGIPPEAKVALFVGRMLKRKGIDTILEALGPILGKENLYLAYVGGWEQPPEGFFSDEAGLLDRMKDRIAQEGWQKRVFFLGRRNDVPHLMASSDVLVHPARIEGFGLVLAEAMAAGLPVVASNVQGIPEVLTGTDSIMVPPDDPHAFREAVLKTLNRSSEEAVQVIEKGRERAEDFRMDRRIDSLVDYFQKVMAEQMKVKRTLLYGPPLNPKKAFYGGGAGGYARNLQTYLLFSSASVKLKPCCHSVRKSGRLFMLAFPWRLVSDVLRAFFASISASGMHILGQYRTAVYRELGVVLACRITHTPVLYDIKAGAFQRWFLSSGPLVQAIMTHILRSAKVILCEGQTDVEFLEKQFSLKAHFFPNFVSSASLTERVGEKLTGKNIRVLFVGFCYEGKGVFELVDGCRLAAERGLPVELTFVGQEHEEFTRYLDSISPSSCPIKRMGVMAHKDVLLQYEQHDVFCMASKHPGEGHTNSVNEAMSMGMVIVSTRHGFLESVLKGDCSYFLEELTPDEIAGTLAIIHVNRDEARRRAHNARERLLTAFTSDVAFAKLASHYDVLTGKMEKRA